jgi:hypothetical protein
LFAQGEEGWHEFAQDHNPSGPLVSRYNADDLLPTVGMCQALGLVRMSSEAEAQVGRVGWGRVAGSAGTAHGHPRWPFQMAVARTRQGWLTWLTGPLVAFACR